MHANASDRVDLGCRRGGGSMRWQQLFADLQAQFEAEEAAVERAESASRARRGDRGAVRRSTGCAARWGRPVVLRCRGRGHRSRATLVDVGTDWLLARGRRAAGRAWWRRRRCGRSPAWAGGRRRRRRPGRSAGGWTCGGRCAALARDRERRPDGARRRGGADRDAGPGGRGLRGAGRAPGRPAAAVRGGAGRARGRHRARSPSSGRCRRDSA